MHSRFLRTLATTAWLLLFATTALRAQCPLSWLPGDPLPFVRGVVRATTVWDPDGAGPAAPVLVVGGEFAAGTMLATGIAAFDGSTWSALGTPPMANVGALAVHNGMLVAAGGSGSQQPIATWNGSTWTVLGATNGAVNAMTVFNNDLYVGGLFRILNGVQVRSLARWNGTAWSEPGGGVGGDVRALAVFGSLYVGGSLSSAGPLPIQNLAVWNGTSWSSGGAFDGTVESLAARIGQTSTTTFLFAGGSFTNVGPVAAARVARFTSSTAAWSAIPGLPGTSCRALHVRNTGSFTFQLHAGVDNPGAADKVWRLNGTSWTSLGAITDAVDPSPTTLSFWNGQYVVGLDRTPALTTPLEQAVRLHDGTNWQPVRGPGLDGPVYCATTIGDDAVIGGAFENAGNVALRRIARGRPGAWTPLGSGFANGFVNAVCRLPNGDIVAGGSFTVAGVTVVNHIARWDGTAWHPLGTGTDQHVYALAVMPNGDLVAGGGFTIAGGVNSNFVARWDGTSWSPLGVGMEYLVTALAVKKNGTLVAAGQFTMADGASANRIAVWDGVAWSPLGTGLDNDASSIAVLPNDDVVVGGYFGHAGGVPSPRVARWNGTTWIAESSPMLAWDSAVLTLLALPNGDYLAAGESSFFGLGGPFGGSDAAVARQSGGAGSLTWTPLDLDGAFVMAATATTNGDLFFGGSFDAVGGVASHDVALLTPGCRALAATYGSGCIGSGGPNQLVVQSMPWIGGTFEARATGMPASGFVIAITGLSTASVPLALLLPEGVPGCDLLASLDILGAAFPTGGVATTQLGLANTMSLAGVVFHHQAVPFEIGPGGNVVAITATNGLTLTIGVL